MKTSFQITKDQVALTRQMGRPPKYPFKQMEPGDSFYFHPRLYLQVLSAMMHFQRRHKQKFTVSKAQCRCLRIS